MIPLFILIFVVGVTPFSGEPRHVWISVDTTEPNRSSDSRLALYSTQCLANSVASLVVRQDLGQVDDVDPYEGLRKAATQIAFDSEHWGYTRVVSSLVQRGHEMVPAIAYITPYLDAGEQPPDEDWMVAIMRQHQSDCQDEERYRLQSESTAQREILDDITDLRGLLECAAINAERLETEDIPLLATQNAELIRLATRIVPDRGESVEERIATLRNGFVGYMFTSEAANDDTINDLLPDMIDRCAGTIDDLQAAGHITLP